MEPDFAQDFIDDAYGGDNFQSGIAIALYACRSRGIQWAVLSESPGPFGSTIKLLEGWVVKPNYQPDVKPLEDVIKTIFP